MISELSIHRALTESDWATVESIRTRVFIEEQGCPADEEWDEFDAVGGRYSSCRHFLGELDGEAVATARWHPCEHGDNPAAKLGRFAVLSEFRGKGYGRAMIAHLIADARASGFPLLVLHAQTYLERLYAEFGFVRTGEDFEEAGIPHVKMVSTGEP